jgi:murein DD-endopeptidase MepM/ murein hydrolase activator NlpD
VKTQIRAAALAATATAVLACASAAAPRPAAASLPAPEGGGPVMPLEVMPHYGDGPGAGRGHEGQDLFAPAGTGEVAIVDAVVTETGSGYQGGRGNYVSIYSAETGRTYNYFHMLTAPEVRVGQRVSGGQELGELGCTGSCWGPHLHFEMRRGNDEYGPIEDPRPLLERLDLTSATPAAFSTAVRP